MELTSQQVLYIVLGALGLYLIGMLPYIIQSAKSRQANNAINPQAVKECQENQIEIFGEGSPTDEILIAVITAAVQSMWQSDSEFVVRRVQRIHNSPAWQRSGREEQAYSRQ